MKINAQYLNSKNYSEANVIELRNVCNCSGCVAGFGFNQLTSLGPGVSGGVVTKDCVKTGGAILSS